MSDYSYSKNHSGFTLVEIAIVLLIIGVLLGGVLKSLTLIEQARAKDLIRSVNEINIAWNSFYDRFNARPGDFSSASTLLTTGAVDGDGNQRVDALAEVGAFWQHLSSAGMIAGHFDGQAPADAYDLNCNNTTCPDNPFGGFFKVSYSDFGDGNGSDKNNELYTGGGIPALILRELDLKLDDGLADSGNIRVHAKSASCASAGQWNGAQSQDCAAAIRLN